MCDTSHAQVHTDLTALALEVGHQLLEDVLLVFLGDVGEDISESRNISIEQLNQYADNMMDMKTASEYVACGLADTLMYKDGVLDYLKTMSGRETDESLRTLTVADMKNVKRNIPLWDSADRSRRNGW